MEEKTEHVEKVVAKPVQVKQNEKTKLHVPAENIYKTYILDKTGEIGLVCVFCANTLSQSDLTMLFSEKQLTFFESSHISIIFCDGLLFKDDTVHSIKWKIIAELTRLREEKGAKDNTAYSVDELYLFSETTAEFDIDKMFQEATVNETRPLTKDRFFQYALNMNVDPFQITDFELDRSSKTTPLEKEEFTYEDWRLLFSSVDEDADQKQKEVGPSNKTIFQPIGRKFQEDYDFLFSANPYQVQIFTEDTRFSMSTKNPLYSFENTLLLQYTSSTDLYVCLAENVLTYSMEKGIDQSYLYSLYFPFLEKRGLTDLDALIQGRTVLAEETAKQLTMPAFTRHHELLNTFHTIYWNKRAELPYVERGIRSFAIVLRPSDNKHLLPLDILFKRVHATADIPFIKYNPGYRRENMYRLFSNRISTNGKKIPVLPEALIMKLSRETGKSQQISFYLRASLSKKLSPVGAAEKTKVQELFIHIDANSYIQVTGLLVELMNPEQLTDFLLETIRPVLDTFNSVLQSSGYTIRPFQTLSSTQDVENAQYVYEAVLPIEKTVNLAKQRGYVHSVFDVISDDVVKGAEMRFKRVDNFKEMDQQSAMIVEVYQRTGHYQFVIEALMANYGLTDEEARLRLATYTSEHQQYKGKILDSPGFPVSLKMRPLKNEIMVEINGITSIDYIDILHLYVDTVLRMTQEPLSTSIPTQKLKSFLQMSKTAAMGTGSGNGSGNGSGPTSTVSSVPYVEEVDNIVAPANLPIQIGMAQKGPLVFGLDEDEVGIDELGIDELGEDEVGAVEKDNIGVQYTLEEGVEDDGMKQMDEDEEVVAAQDDNAGGIMFDDDYDYEDEEQEEQEQEGDEGGEGQQQELEQEEQELEQEPSKTLPKNIAYGGEGTEEEEDDDSAPEQSDAYQANIDGMSISNPSPFFKKMQELDPVLFVTEEQGQFPLYSRACPSSDKRQPVILTDEEKQRIDRTSPGSYEHAIKYGSNPDKKYWYICPRYWCLKTNSSISEADVKAGKCGAIIPANAKTVPKGAYVYEFSNPKEHIGKDGKYIKHVPSFLEKSKHPNGLCIPCCFKKEWDSAQHVKRRDQCSQEEAAERADQDNGPKEPEGKSRGKAKQADASPSSKVVTYIIGSVSYPIANKRWGFLPMSIQLFLNTDNSLATTKQNPAIIKPGAPTLLRYGVEQTKTQSFLGSVAHFYAYKHNLERTPTIAEMRGILARAITLDLFLKYHNGNLATIFRPKRIDQGSFDIDRYADTDFYKSIDLQNEAQLDYLEDIVAAYENFVDFLQKEDSTIDHTYLWDMVVDRNPKLMRDGFNLVILALADHDITDKVQMLCPNNAYSATTYDPTKETIILLKQEEYYEPIHLYEQIQTGEIMIKKAFLEYAAIQPIRAMLDLIKQATGKYCSPLPSMPRIYKFKRNIPVQDMIRLLKVHQYRVESQIANYRNKIIGLQINREEGQDLLFVPCYPSAAVQGLKMHYMDEDDLWIDYRHTRDRLLGLSIDTEGKILSKPMIKVVEDDMVVGFLTETNQFVQISPPSQNLDEDGIETVYHSSYAMKNGKNAEKTLTTVKSADKERQDTVQKIRLETEFYNVFRSIVRLLLNDFENRASRKTILETIRNVGITHHNKIRTIEAQIRRLMKDAVVFQEMETNVLAQIEEVIMCQSPDGSQCTTMGAKQKYCLANMEGGCRTILPKRHLLTGKDNERIYFGRMADELLRYRRIQLFMFHSKNYLNISNSDYQIFESELFLLESLLNHEYFRDIAAYPMQRQAENVEYDTATPAIAQVYLNEISLAEQGVMKQRASETASMSDYILDCIQETKSRVVGNDKAGSWRPVFPVSAKEIVFKSSVLCSYIPVIYLLQAMHKNANFSVQNVKTALWNGYKPWLELYDKKIVAILQKQGKRELMEPVKRGRMDLEHAIFSDGYYLTDLDWWIFAQYTHSPIILFSSTTLKMMFGPVQWLRLSQPMNASDKYFFVRSPSEVKKNEPSSYHILSERYSFDQLRGPGSMFLEAERGNSAYSENMQTLDTFLSKFHMVSRVAKI